MKKKCIIANNLHYLAHAIIGCVVLNILPDSSLPIWAQTVCAIAIVVSFIFMIIYGSLYESIISKIGDGMPKRSYSFKLDDENQKKLIELLEHFEEITDDKARCE